MDYSSKPQIKDGKGKECIETAKTNFTPICDLGINFYQNHPFEPKKSEN